jgi:hypothetical protein
MRNKNHIGLQLETNSIVDEGNGFIRVKGGLTLTDESNQRNNTRYDVKTLDIESEYDGKLHANHGTEFGGYNIETVIGKLVGVAKKGKRVVADGIQYAVNANPLATLAYEMTKGGFLTDFSIGTFGAEPDEDGTFKNHVLFEVSQVGIGNNRNAKLNTIVANSIEQAKQNGLDTTELEQMFHVNEVEAEQVEAKETNKETTMSYKTVKNSRDFAVKVTFKNASEEEVTTEVPAGGSVDVSDEQVEAVQNQIAGASAPATDIQAIVNAALAPLQEKVAQYENAFNASAKEPEFKLNGGKATAVNASAKNVLATLDTDEIHQHQIEAARRMLTGDFSASQELQQINAYNFERLKEAKLVKNSMTIADMGNFVISPELLSEIQGCRTDYSALINATEWRETMSTQMAWLERSGDIDMQEVAFCEDTDGSVGANDNLKPISEYGATPRTSDLSEVAAVTPVCNAATRFLAVDILGDVAAGYRNDYDRKRAQLVVARMQQAIDANGNSVSYDTTSAVTALSSYLDVLGEISTCTPNGTFILSDKSFIELRKQILAAGGSDVYNAVFFRGENGVPTIDGKPYIIVPSDLLPTLGTAETKTFTVDGVEVEITEAVFYMNLSNFTGRTSGGLQYDLATQASYESAGVVKSAFQRNEVVLRGSFFRGGAIKDQNQVASLAAPAVS